MKFKKTFASIAAGVLIAAWLLYPTTNRELKARGIPPLPDSAEIENETAGGFFAGWMFVKATLSEKAFADYASRFTMPRQIIGRAKGEVLIVARKDMEALWQNYPEAEIIFQESLQGIDRWWLTHTIQDGFVFRWTDGVDGWRVYCDERTRTVYIYWHHS